jgi:hypothetical protein
MLGSGVKPAEQQQGARLRKRAAHITPWMLTQLPLQHPWVRNVVEQQQHGHQQEGQGAVATGSAAG